jgi:hypothetical protein
MSRKTIISGRQWFFQVIKAKNPWKFIYQESQLQEEFNENSSKKNNKIIQILQEGNSNIHKTLHLKKNSKCLSMKKSLNLHWIRKSEQIVQIKARKNQNKEIIFYLIFQQRFNLKIQERNWRIETKKIEKLEHQQTMTNEKSIYLNIYNIKKINRTIRVRSKSALLFFMSLSLFGLQIFIKFKKRFFFTKNFFCKNVT